MRRVDELFKRASRLDPNELSDLAAQIRRRLSAIRKRNGPGKRAYARTLALSGAGRALSPNISSEKAEHISDAFAMRRG